MQLIKWECCPLVAANAVTRSFIEQLAKERKAANTVENYSRDLEDFLEAFADRPFSAVLEVDEEVIAHYVDELWHREAHRGSGHKRDMGTRISLAGSMLAPNTVRRRVGTVRLFFDWCIRRRHRRDAINPVRRGVRGQTRGLVSVPTSEPWIPDDGQWVTILTYLFTHLSVRDQALVLVAYDGALRREEVVHLRTEDIEWKTHTITLRSEMSKNKVPGIVVLSHTTFRVLQRYIVGDRARLVALYGGDTDGPIFLSDSVRNPGQPLTKWTVKDVFDRMRDALGLPHLTPHTLRHLMLTDLVKSGMDLSDVQVYGRHKSPASTQIYVHRDKSRLARQVNKAHAWRQKQIERVRQEAEVTGHGAG